MFLKYVVTETTLVEQRSRQYGGRKIIRERYKRYWLRPTKGWSAKSDKGFRDVVVPFLGEQRRIIFDSLR